MFTTETVVDKPTQPSRFGAFLARHTLALTLIGSGGTLLSFLCKDVVRDHYKDAADGVQGAAQAYLATESNYPPEAIERARQAFERRSDSTRRLAETEPKSALQDVGVVEND